MFVTGLLTALMLLLLSLGAAMAVGAIYNARDWLAERKRDKARSHIFDKNSKFTHLLDWDDYPPLDNMPDDFYVLRDDVSDWCKENLAGDYGVKQPKRHDDPVHIWFDDPNDASLFKLRWG